MAKLAWKLGTVIWFDEYSGEGELRGPDGEDFFIHYSAIQSKSKWKKLRSNEKVKFLESSDPKRKSVSKVAEA